MSSLNSRELYPEINPYKESFIKGDDTHEIFVEESGNPEGQPILFLHGGPGGGTGAKQRRFFDPSYYRIILFDQRGCGKSKPLGETLKNTTDNLVNDIELIRKELNINKSIKLGVMINSSEFSKSKNLEKDIRFLFPFSKEKI